MQVLALDRVHGLGTRYGPDLLGARCCAEVSWIMMCSRRVGLGSTTIACAAGDNICQMAENWGNVSRARA